MSNTKRKYNKKGKILIHLGNVYALGGDLIGGLLGGVASLGTQALSNLTVPEVENLKITANSIDSLSALMSAYKPIEIEKTNAGGAALSGVASGATAGMAFGPWGAAIGGAIGGLSGGISSLVGNKKREIAENQANALQANKFQSAASNIQKSLMNNLLANYAANGGQLGMTGMMKSRMALANAFGNKSALRMVSANPNTYTFTGKEGTKEKVGTLGTHYMGSYGNIARPSIQEVNGKMLFMGFPATRTDEDIKFNTPQDAEYFSEHYKEIAPMMNSGKFANGGGLNTFENGGTHEQNPLGGIPQGVDENGTPNLVEQGESKYNNYIFSDRLKYDKKNTFSDMAKKFAKESKERPNDPISKRGLESNLGKLKLAQDFYKTISSSDNTANTFEYGGPTLFQMPNWFKMAAEKPVSLIPPTLIEKPVEKPVSPTPTTVVKKPVVRTPINKSVATLGIQDYSQELLDDQLADVAANMQTPLSKKTPSKVEINNAIMGENLMNLDPITYNPEKDKKGKKDYSTLLRYAPALASGIATLTDALGTTNKPDYTAAKELEGIQVKGERLGNYLSYRPLDQNYFTNLLRANAAATRSALRGASGGNRATYMAGLIGADSSYNEGLGKLARQAVESNIAQKHQVEQFNRGTDQFNAQQSNWEQGINTQNKATAVGLREQARQTANTAKMTNLNNFLESIGGIGQENLFRNMIKNDPNSPHYIDATGKFVFKGSEGNVGKNGGKLKTKSITYGW